MTQLTTHVLDTANGLPAAGMTLRLLRLQGSQRELVLSTTTNSDGRTGAPLLSGSDMAAGTYELEFDVSDYFKLESNADSPPFLGCVVLRFGIADATSHYHVPLLVSPYSYSTYRGS